MPLLVWHFLWFGMLCYAFLHWLHTWLHNFVSLWVFCIFINNKIWILHQPVLDRSQKKRLYYLWHCFLFLFGSQPIDSWSMQDCVISLENQNISWFIIISPQITLLKHDSPISICSCPRLSLLSGWRGALLWLWWIKNDEKVVENSIDISENWQNKAMFRQTRGGRGVVSSWNNGRREKTFSPDKHLDDGLVNSHSCHSVALSVVLRVAWHDYCAARRTNASLIQQQVGCLLGLKP